MAISRAKVGLCAFLPVPEAPTLALPCGWLGQQRPPQQQDNSLLQEVFGFGSSISNKILGSGLSTLVLATKIYSQG